jgi:alpha-tubulin suppressor-like RCC1 family protein
MGQLGDGSGADASGPVEVLELSDALSVTAGADHACGLRATGEVECWGRNDHGQLGDGVEVHETCEHGSLGSLDCSSLPVPVTGLDDVVALAAGGHHTCAARGDGQILCWGLNDQGQLGDGALADSWVPLAVAELDPADQVACGGGHSCASLVTGQLMCWGANDARQLADGTKDDRLAPVSSGGIRDAVQVAAGQAHNCALMDSGQLVCWGWNEYGQIGDGSTGPSTPPRNVTDLSTL